MPPPTTTTRASSPAPEDDERPADQDLGADVDAHPFADDLDRVGVESPGRGEGERLAGADIELGHVEGALDAVLVEVAVAQ